MKKLERSFMNLISTVTPGKKIPNISLACYIFQNLINVTSNLICIKKITGRNLTGQFFNRPITMALQYYHGGPVCRPFHLFKRICLSPDLSIFVLLRSHSTSCFNRNSLYCYSRVYMSRLCLPPYDTTVLKKLRTDDI